MNFDLSQFHQTFFEETKEHLEEIEKFLLGLDVEKPDFEDINAIFRAAHSIKGGAGTFGFSDIAKVTHALESLLDLVRKQQITLTIEIVDASLEASDIIKAQLASHRDHVDFDPEEAAPVIVRLERLAKAGLNVEEVVALGSADSGQAVVMPAAEIVAEGDSPASEGGAGPRLYVIRFNADTVSEETLAALEGELRKLGELEKSGSSDNVQYLLNGARSVADIEDVISFVASPEHYQIESMERVTPPGGADENDSDPGYGFFEPLPSPSTAPEIEGDGFGFFVDPASLRKPPEPDPGYGFFVDVEAPRAKDSAAVKTQPNVDADGLPRRRASDREPDSSIRVSIEKVDLLINLVGELVITNAMLSQTVSKLDPIHHQNLYNGIGQLDRSSRDLQDAVMSIRMLPIGSVFARFPRLVRDLASKLGKQVELKMIGESTELDKGLIERLADPLTHLVRNSLDHGIELPDVREQHGKPAKGLLTLEAFHHGGNIVVQVRDDGGGLNRERIFAKAKERGIAIEPDISDQDLWQLIFAPGFSTAEQVTDVSGRGVGMDVVKRNIEGMGGRVEILSREGEGTTIRIRLPLTLAILDGMSVGVGDQVFIVPLNMIVESLQPRAEDISTVSGRGRVVFVRGEYVPIVALHEVFAISPHTTSPENGIVIILEIESGKIALFVDELLGQHQVVIKSLETNYRKVRGVSGATIMGDGRVAMILDVSALVQLSRD